VAVVTGASSGIGAAVAKGLARRGAKVVAVARRKDRLEAVVEACRADSPESLAHPADVSVREACEGVVATAQERFGRVDIVVNNAGISVHKNAARTTVDDVERVMAVNFFGPVYMTLAALPGMIEHGLVHLTVPRRYGLVGALYPVLGRPLRWAMLKYAARTEKQSQDR